MLKVHVENLGQIAILHLAGHVVFGDEVEVLRRSVLSQSHMSAVVLDLRRVSRIDARGLGLLLELREKLQSSGIEFRLIKVARLVQQVLRIACLDSVFLISSEEEIRSWNSLVPALEEA